MTVDTKTNLLTRANQVRTETAGFANTASRLGGLFRDIVDSLSGALGILNVESYGAATGNTGAVNDAAIALAITAATAANAQLYWPAVYPSAASITNLHAVRHRGPGGVLRGSDTFYVEPKAAQINTLYVSTAGTGDGLSSSQPMALGSFFTSLANYGYLDGTWRMRGAAGTYTFAGSTVSGMTSRNRIELYGPDVGGSPNVPTMILDGTGAGADACGFYFRNGMQAYVKDIKFQNYGTLSNGCGVAADEHSNLSTDNVHTTACANGIDVETSSRLYVKGGINSGNQLYNIRAYAQCTVTIGYNSVASRVKIGSVVNGGGAGILVRDDSSGHIDYTDIDGVTGSGGGVQVQNQSRVHLVSCVFGGVTPNYYNVRLDTQSTFVETSCTFNAATARSVVEFGFSLDNDANQSIYYDRATGFFRFGLTTSVVPRVPWHWLLTEADGVGISYNSNVTTAIEDDSPYLAFGANATGSGGIMFARPGANNQGRFEYLFSSEIVQLRVNAQDAFQWHQNNSAGAFFRPVVTGANAPELGDATHPWRKVYAGSAGVFWTSGTGTPEGVVTAPVGSLYTRTDSATTLYVKQTGAGNTGWVAK